MTASKFEEALVFAYQILGDGKGKRLTWEEVYDAENEDVLIWVHLNYSEANAKKLIQQTSQLDESLIPYLLTEDSRPGVFVHEDNLLMSMRGINFNADQDPEDLVSVRLYISKNRIISLRRRKVHILEEIAGSLDQGRGVCDPAQFLTEAVSRVVEKIGDHTDLLDERIAVLEKELLGAGSSTVGDDLIDIQTELIELRRYLSPQKLMLTQLLDEEVDWILPKSHNKLRTQVEFHTRYVEDLDYCWQRTRVIKEELTSRQNEQLNHKLYVLALVSCVFLPLSLLTGLLGVNVSGIPFAEKSYAFVSLSVMMVLIAGMILLYFKRKKWF